MEGIIMKDNKQVVVFFQGIGQYVCENEQDRR